MSTIQKHYGRLGKQYGRHLVASGSILTDKVKDYIPKKTNEKKRFSLFGK